MLALWMKSCDKPRQHIKKETLLCWQRSIQSKLWFFHTFYVWMWELDHSEGWVPKDWCFWIVVLDKTPESPLNCKEVKPVNSKGSQSWIFIGRTDAEAPILWSPDAKSWLIGKDLTHWKRPWCWERLRAKREGDNKGWDGWMVSLTQWIWVWANSGK